MSVHVSAFSMYCIKTIQNNINTEWVWLLEREGTDKDSRRIPVVIFLSHADMTVACFQGVYFFICLPFHCLNLSE